MVCCERIFVVAAAMCLVSLGSVMAADDGTEKNDDELLQQIDQLRSAEDSASAARQLISLDARISASHSADRLSAALLNALADLDAQTAEEHLCAVFESDPNRRHLAAVALSRLALRRPASDQIWRYLVRSLPIVEGDDAVSVLKALNRFRRRATKPTWVREVILIGLRLPETDLPVVTQLLAHWTGHRPRGGLSEKEKLLEYQRWFAESFPDQPVAKSPSEAAGTRWTLARLLQVTADLQGADPVAGAAVFVRANCHKCHRREGVGTSPADDRLGPDLTSLGWRRQKKEILTAIVFPSHHLNDEYPVTTVVLKNGKSVSGLMFPAADGSLKIVQSDGSETVVRADEIEETANARISSMPAGLLEELSEDEVRNLTAFLIQQIGSYKMHREQQ